MSLENITKEIKPIIISASRATDIPAFYFYWFLEKIKIGHLYWKNPYNKFFYKINLNKVKFFVFWSKFPIQLYKNINCLVNYNFYIHYTINDYENEKIIEPNIPSLSERIKLFKDLSNKVGKDRIIWRFDPIIISKKNSLKVIVEKIYKLTKILKDYTSILIISFVDINNYLKVKRRIEKLYPYIREPNFDEIRYLAKNIGQICNSFNLECYACAEKFDLQKFNIKPGKCINDDIIRKSSNDEVLINFLKQTKKDKGQRKYCGCIESKDIGFYNSCKFNCLYCYSY